MGESGRFRCPHCQFENLLTRPFHAGDQADGSPAFLLERLDRFQILSEIGEGGFGIVYLAWDQQLERQVAIKIPKRVRASNSGMFIREARTASKLRHPNIVTIHDVGTLSDQIYIVSEYIPGPTISSWMAAAQPSIEAACQLLIRICRAVAFAHRGGVIHRDLKPANILLADDQPVILDFGLSYSLVLSGEATESGDTRAGTPSYMSPEQITGNTADIDRWTDTYALGVLLYQLLTGHLPFTGSASEVMEAVLHKSPPPPRSINPRIPKSLQAICLKAMHKAPEGRYQSADELADDLQAFLDGHRVKAYQGVDGRRLKAIARRRFLVATASVSGLGLVGAGAWIYGRWRADHPRTAVFQPTQPATAQLTWVPIHPSTGELLTEQRRVTTAGTQQWIAPGPYKVYATWEDTWCEVLRWVPGENEIPMFEMLGIPTYHRAWLREPDGMYMEPIRRPAIPRSLDDMVLLAAGQVTSGPGIGKLSNLTTSISEFWIDRREVTYGQILDVFPNWSKGRGEPLDQPAANVMFDVAVAYAEAVGKALPTAWELLWGASNRGKTRFPWGNSLPTDPRWTLDYREAEFDQTRDDPPILGLYSGLGEWTVTSVPPLSLEPIDNSDARSNPANNNVLDQRAIFGIPNAPLDRLEMEYDDSSRMDFFGFWNTNSLSPKFGMRCIRRVAKP